MFSNKKKETACMLQLFRWSLGNAYRWQERLEAFSIHFVLHKLKFNLKLITLFQSANNAGAGFHRHLVSYSSGCKPRAKASIRRVEQPFPWLQSDTQEWLYKLEQLKQVINRFKWLKPRVYELFQNGIFNKRQSAILCKTL